MGWGPTSVLMKSRWLSFPVFGILALFVGGLIAIASGDSYEFAYQLSAFTQGVVQSEAVGQVMWTCFIVAVVAMSIVLATRPYPQGGLFVAISFLSAWLLSAATWSLGKDLEDADRVTLGTVLGFLPETVLGVLLITFIVLVLAIPMAALVRWVIKLRHSREGAARVKNE